jgi:hypothetical protein
MNIKVAQHPHVQKNGRKRDCKRIMIEGRELLLECIGHTLSCSVSRQLWLLI